MDRPDQRNDYSIEATEGERGWEVRILQHDGSVAWSRACRDASQAATLASTVRQHAFWLSPGKFREYYRLPSM